MRSGTRYVGAAATLALLAAVLGAVVAPAGADGTGDAWTDGRSVGASAADDDATSGRGGGGGGSAVTCTYERLGPDDARAADEMAGLGILAGGQGAGAWYRRNCRGPGGAWSAATVWVPAADPVALARRARDQVPVPAPAVGTSPPATEGALVNVPTWLWVDRSLWRPVSVTVTAGDVTVTATATPQRVEWSTGDGGGLTCAGPGTPYDPARPPAAQSSDCTWTYRRSSAGAPGGAYTVTATVVYAVSWSAVGAPGGGGLGELRRSASVRLAVKEIQAVNR
jgi:hypothetical protein